MADPQPYQSPNPFGAGVTENSYEKFRRESQAHAAAQEKAKSDQARTDLQRADAEAPQGYAPVRGLFGNQTFGAVTPGLGRDEIPAYLRPNVQQVTPESVGGGSLAALDRLIGGLGSLFGAKPAATSFAQTAAADINARRQQAVRYPQGIGARPAHEQAIYEQITGAQQAYGTAGQSLRRFGQGMSEAARQQALAQGTSSQALQSRQAAALAQLQGGAGAGANQLLRSSLQAGGQARSAADFYTGATGAGADLEATRAGGFGDISFGGSLESQAYANQARAQQQAALGLLAQQAIGTGPSVAAIQQQQGLESAIRSQQALAASTRGNTALAQRQAASNIANLQAQGVQQAAALRADEITKARLALTGETGGVRGQDLTGQQLGQQGALGFGGLSQGANAQRLGIAQLQQQAASDYNQLAQGANQQNIQLAQLAQQGALGFGELGQGANQQNVQLAQLGLGTATDYAQLAQQANAQGLTLDELIQRGALGQAGLLSQNQIAAQGIAADVYNAGQGRKSNLFGQIFGGLLGAGAGILGTVVGGPAGGAVGSAIGGGIGNKISQL